MRNYCSIGIMAIILLMFTLAPFNSSAQTKPPNSSQQNRTTNAANLTKRLQSLIDNGVKNGLPGVSLAVFKPDCGLITLTSGFSDIKAGRKMSPQDHFRLASCSKPYIGVLIMQLVEEDKLSLDDPIKKYLPTEVVAHIQNVDQTTVRQLMNHTSGIYDYFNDQFSEVAAAHPGKLYSLAEALPFAYDKPARFSPPGSGYYYSNTNTILLAVIIEHILKIPFTQALHQRIFSPLKLTNTYNDYADPIIEPLARGYFFERPDKKTDYTEVNQGYGLADGVIVANAQDILIFMRALLHENSLLKPQTLTEMLKVDQAAQAAQEGLNLFVFTNYYKGVAGPVIGHDGEYGGYKTEMFYFADQDIVVVLLTNCSGVGINAKWNRLFDDIALTITR